MEEEVDELQKAMVELVTGTEGLWFVDPEDHVLILSMSQRTSHPWWMT